MTVFLSHSQSDRKEVRAISTGLIELNKKVWWDSIKLRVGDELTPNILRAIDTADIFVVVMSAAAARSAWVSKEVQHALKREADGELRIIPTRLDKQGVLPDLADRIFIDLDRADLSAGIGQLLDEVETISRPAPPTARVADPDERTFTDHALEVRRTADDRLVINLDVCSFDLDESYSVLSQFEFKSRVAFSADHTDLEQAYRLLRACRDECDREPSHVALASKTVTRFELEVADHGDEFDVRCRVRRIGRSSFGTVIFNLGALFGLVYGSHPRGEDAEAP